MKKEVIVYVRNLNVKIKADYNDLLGDVLAKNGLLPLPCGGRGFCGQCLVRVRGKVSDPTGNELSRGLGGELRLACQTRLLGNVEVELFHKPSFNISRYSYNITIRAIDPIYKISDVDSGNLPLDFSSEIVVVRDYCFRHGDKIVSLFDHPLSTIRNYNEKGFRILLIDIGTSKIAYQVMDESGNILVEKTILNPLVRYGADIITRLTYIIDDERKAVEMKNALMKTLENITASYENIILLAFAGNTVNQSIALGLPIDKLAVKPYQPYFKGPFIGVTDNCIPFYAAPFIGGFVGGDAFSNIAAVEYMKLEKPYLIIDIGTNTEVVVGTGRDKDPIYATSTPAGPAFEGHIESGAGVGLPGISKVRIKSIKDEQVVFEYTVEGGIKPAGLLGSGVISLVAELLRNKIIDKKGRITKGYTRVKGVRTITITNPNETVTGKPITFSQLDVRELQKAVAAVKTSWQLLLREANVRVDCLKWVIVTGNFGSAIDVDDAFLLGILPGVPKERVIVAGNMVLTGLKTLVFDAGHERRMRGLLKRVKSIDLAESKDFTNMWVKNLEFSIIE